jgi:hypothetical protein
MCNIIIIRLNTSGKEGHSVILNFLGDVTNDVDADKPITLLINVLNGTAQLYVILR